MNDDKLIELKKEFENWIIERENWTGYESQLNYFFEIKKNIPEIIKYYDSINQEQKEKLKNHAINGLLWEIKQKSIINLNQFITLNNLWSETYIEAKKNNSKKELIVLEKKFILENVDIEENIFNTIIFERSADYFLNENKEYYSELLNDVRISEIIGLIVKTFKVNSANFGNNSKLINFNNLYDVFDIILSIFNNDLNKCVELNQKISGCNAPIYEVFGFYNLDKGKFIFNSRWKTFFKYFYGLKKIENPSELTNIFEEFKEQYISTFENNLLISKINDILIQNDLILSEDSKNNIQISLQIDQFIWNFTSKIQKKWLFMIRSEFEKGKVWEYSKEHGILMMHYLESDSKYQLNINYLKKINEGDLVVTYINNKTIGGIGEVTKTYYKDNSNDNGFEGKFSHRLDVDWLYLDFEKKLDDIEDKISFSKNNYIKLASKTIHDLSENDFKLIEKLFKNSTSNNSSQDINETTNTINLLKNKKQIILYGSPGTGKTYNTKQIAIKLIGDDLNE
ncbi:MAG: EVE domain-containing protein [Candidatus Woesearchaeota archaeon]